MIMITYNLDDQSDFLVKITAKRYQVFKYNLLKSIRIIDQIEIII
jgi:hypothetical protein